MCEYRERCPIAYVEFHEQATQIGSDSWKAQIQFVRDLLVRSPGSD